MSYILDALRRADAERERGAVPSLQSQQHTIIEDDAAPDRPRSLVWAVVALAIAVLVLLAWNSWAEPRRRRVRPSKGRSRRRCRHRCRASACARAADRDRAGRAAGGGRCAADTTATPAPALQPTAAPPRSRRLRRRREPRRCAPRASAAAGRSEPVRRRPRRPAPHRPAAEPRVHAQAELPEDIRRDLPKLVIGGSSYSGDAASRMVMINGQVFHEGDRLAPDLVLERIRLKSAVLAFKGWRYEVLF
jgi:general secretion pathway protein B